MLTKDQTEFTYGENTYVINAMDASFGLEVMNELGKLTANNSSPSASFIKSVVLKSITFNNKAVNEKWFDKHFSRNYGELMALFNRIIEFNFGEMGADGVPNEEGGTSD